MFSTVSGGELAQAANSDASRTTQAVFVL